MKVSAENAVLKQTGRRWQSSSRGPFLRSSSSAVQQYCRSKKHKRTFDAIPIGSWRSTEVAQWLDSIGLSKGYRSVFAEIDGASVASLGLDDLDFLQVRSPADRKKLLQAIADLNAAQSRGWTLRKFHANPPVANRRRQEAAKPPTPPSPTLRLHWSRIKPLADETVDPPTEQIVNASDSVTKRALLDDDTCGTIWNTGQKTLLDGTLDEAAQRDAFRQAVDAWRRGGREPSSSQAMTQSRSCGGDAAGGGTTPRKSAQQVADELAQRLDEAYAVETAALARRKKEARDKLLDRRRQELQRQDSGSFFERCEEEEEQQQQQQHLVGSSPRISLVESRLGCTDQGRGGEDAVGLPLGYTVIEA